MRIFWISLLIAAALAAAWSFWPERDRRPKSVDPPASPDRDTTSTPESERTSSTDPIESKVALPEASAAIAPSPAAPTSSESDVVAAIEAEPPTAVPTPSGPAEPALEPEPLTLGLEASIPEATIIAGSIVRGPKDLLLADDRFEIEGDGTRENPFRVSWELLVSAGENYRPRVGDRGIPQRIAMLDGKWVAIDGYVAFPMLVGTTSEALVMLNRWDGCCIGVPPSPYDAIEVKLDRPVVRTQMHAIDYGEVVGVLEVEPYLVDDWLVGLYLMDDAMLKLDL